MCSTLTSRGASSTIDALVFGANDYVTKPSNSGPMDTALKMLKDELIPKIKQFFAASNLTPAPRASSLSAAPAFVRPARAAIPGAERKILAIGVSTGGPTALMEIMPQFPASFPLPVVIVQHMPPLFTK
jgi:two-component system chemotaxis response regulator CheB